MINNISINARKIGVQLAQLRKEKNLTQEELGKKINISSNHISTVENGGSYSLNTLMAICDGLDTTLDFVLYGNIRNNDKDNFIELINLCSDKEIAVLSAVAHTLINNREK